jgi:histone acetyltransferase (RNA polymerase elongator complex component)
MALIIPFFIAHQGCPHRCLFCDQHVVTGHTSADRAPVSIEAQVRATVARWRDRARPTGMVQLAFYGGSFTCLDESVRHRLLAAATAQRDAGRIDSIRISTRPDCLDPVMLAYLGEHGVDTVEIGIQSFNDDVLRTARRGHLANDAITAVRAVRAAGLRVGVQLLIGLPGESTGSFLAGISQTIAERPDCVRLYPLLVLKQTILANWYVSGVYHPLSLARAVCLTKLARRRLLEAGIKVIRMGLQPTNALAGQVMAGPYHPAFGELVISADWYGRARRLLATSQPGEHISFTVTGKDYSAFVGQRRVNMQRLCRRFPDRTITVHRDPSLHRNELHYAVH